MDTGATVSVCRPGTFKAAVDPEQKQKLYSVDDTLLDTKGVTEPVLELGDQNRQTARTTFQVVEGITDDILSVNRAVDAGAKAVFHKPRSYIEWEDGQQAEFFRQGNQFLMPYTELAKAKRATIAPVAAEVINVIVDDPEAEAVEEWARREAEREAAAAAAEEADHLEAGPSASAPEPESAGVPAEPSAEERAQHMLTHVPFKPWCEHCIQGAGRGGHRRKTDPADGSLETVVQMDYTFYSRGANQHRIEGESTLVTVLNLVDKDTGWPLAPKCRERVGKAVPTYLTA